MNIDKDYITKQVNNHMKTSKKEFEAEIWKIINEGVISEYEIQNILIMGAKIFDIKPSNKIKNDGFFYVAQVCDKKDGRQFSSVVKVKGNQAVGLNSRRVHTAFVNMPDGMYSTKKTLLIEKDQKMKFPDYTELIPNDLTQVKDITIKDFKTISLPNSSTDMKVFLVFEGHYFDPKSIKQAFAGNKEAQIGYRKIEGNTKSGIITLKFSDNNFAIIASEKHSI